MYNYGRPEDRRLKAEDRRLKAEGEVGRDFRLLTPDRRLSTLDWRSEP
ncbi:hypothetical protein M1N22_02900 [Dehalococcoidia bacterium]|nr:hypothetical protein [Dehalococcoidia bacterium]